MKILLGHTLYNSKTKRFLVKDPVFDRELNDFYEVENISALNKVFFIFSENEIALFMKTRSSYSEISDAEGFEKMPIFGEIVNLSV